MNDIDKEISFLDEKIKELSNASIRIKEKDFNSDDCERFWYWSFSTKRNKA